MKSKVFSYIAVAVGILCFVLSLAAFLFASVDFVSAGEKEAIVNEAISTGAKKGDVVRGVTVKKVKDKKGVITVTMDEGEMTAHIIKLQKSIVYGIAIVSIVLGILCVYFASLRTEWKPGVVKGFSSLAKIGLMVSVIVLMAALKNPSLF